MYFNKAKSYLQLTMEALEYPEPPGKWQTFKTLFVRGVWFLWDLLCFAVCLLLRAIIFVFLGYVFFVIYNVVVHKRTILEIPFTELQVDSELVIQGLIKLISSLIKYFEVGPFTVIFSPLTLCPWPLPYFVPFTQSYVALRMMDTIVPFPNLFVNLHLYPSAWLCIPPLSSLRLSSRPDSEIFLSFTLFSVSIISIPVEIFGFNVFSPLSSLFPFSLSSFRLWVVFFPGIKQFKTPIVEPRLSPNLSNTTEHLNGETDSEPYMNLTDMHLNVLDTHESKGYLRGSVYLLSQSAVSSVLGLGVIASRASRCYRF